jgi:ELL-associated factor
MAGADTTATISNGQKFPEGRHTLRLGESMLARTGPTFHTLRYDFKPASVGDCKETYVEVAENQEVTVTVPKLDETGEVRDATMFKGPRKQYQKECLLVYNHDTGEFTLEQLTYNIQLKKTRGEVTEEVLQNIRETRKKLVDSGGIDHSMLAITNANMSNAMPTSSSSNASRNDATPNHVKDTEMMSDSDHSDSESSDGGAGSDEVHSDAEHMDDGEFSEDDLAKSLEAELSSAQRPQMNEVPARESPIGFNRAVQNNHTSQAAPRQNNNHAAAASSHLENDLALSESSDED